MLKVGETAPDFVADTTQETKVRLSDYRGKSNVVLYFYPKAFTPGCSDQARRFRDHYPDIRALGGDVIGVSVDTHDTQCKFSEKYSVAFPLIADTSKAISELYGVLIPVLRFDRRVTFVIDKTGIIRGVFDHMLLIFKHLDESLECLKTLQ